MKIAIDIRNVGKKRTGDEVVFFNLTKNLARIDNENDYELLTDITDENILREIKINLGIENKNNFEIVSLKTANKFVWNFWTLGEYLRKNPTDIYLTQYITPWFVPKSVKILTIIHDISFNFYPQFIKFTDLFFLETLIPISLRRADKILGVSKFTRDEIVKFYKVAPEKVSFIHNAVSDDFLTQDVSPKKIKEVKEKYKLPEKYILYIGTLQPRKNLPALVEAFALLRAENSADAEINFVKLVIAGGKGKNYDKAIDRIVARGNLSKEVFFPGYIDEEDKAALISGAEIFCFPSLYEGFGIPILEAMSMNVPVVVSDIPPHKEIAGNATVFFNPNTAGELAVKLKEVLKNSILRSNLVARGKKQAEKFSWQKTARDMLGIFSSLK